MKTESEVLADCRRYAYECLKNHFSTPDRHSLGIQVFTAFDLEEAYRTGYENAMTVKES